MSSPLRPLSTPPSVPIPMAPPIPPVRPLASHAPAPEEPVITVELSNGDRVEFPASMPVTEIEDVVGRVELSLQVGGLRASHAPVQPDGPSLADRAITTGMRILPTIAGGVIGGAGGPFAPITVPLMAGVGAGLGETAAEMREQQTGERAALNPTQIAFQSLLGAVPGGKALGATPGAIAAYRAGQGALMGATATTGTQYAETGDLPSLGQVATGAVMGGLLGGGLGRLEGGARGRAAVPPSRPSIEVGSVYQHPQYGRVSVVSVADDGTARVTRGGNRMFSVASDTLTPAELPALAPGARYAVTTDGTVVPIGTEVPAPPDPSFVRGVPAEYARREVSGLLPAGREPIITPPPPGSVPDTADPSFVRSVPAQYARREIRGALPAGPRFVAGERVVAPAERAAEIPVEVPRVPTAAESGGRSVPAAVLSREIDASVPAAEGVRVTQYSSDPAAVDVPFLTPDETRMLERMREDLIEFVPQRGRLIRGPGDQAAATYAPGGPGSPVGDDVRVISEQHVGNDKIVEAIDDLLAGKAPTNRLHTAAIDAARGYIEGREGYRGPSLPFSAMRTGRSAVDDFDEFSKLVDDVEPAAMGEPGELGFISPRLAAHLGGGVGGAALGAATGDTPQERAENAVLFGLAGAAAPALIPRRARSVVPRAIPTAGPSLAPGVVEDVVSKIPRTGRAGDPLRDPLAGFEPFLDKFRNPLVRDGVANVIRENGGFAAQRRGTINTKQLGQFANEVRVNIEKVLPKGTALSAEGITAYARALQRTTQKVAELSAKINAGQNTDADLVAFEAARAEQAVIAQSLVGARREAGAALASFNFWGSVLETGDVKLIRDAATPLRDEAAKIAKGFAALPDDPMVRLRWLQDQRKQSWGSMLRAYYLSNLLSGPLTHARNILGNVSNAAFDTVTFPVAAGIDAARSAIRGTPRTVRFSEFPAQVQGTIVGIEKGLQDALFALRHGIHPAALTRSLETAAAKGKLDLPPAELPGGGANPLNWPFRALHAPDALFRSMARESELSAILFNQAKNEGLSGQALVDRVADLRASQHPNIVALRQQADAYASRRVFLEPSGAPTQRVVALAESLPGAYFVLPFIRISSAIARQGAQASPFGFLMRAAREGGRAGTQAQARATAGSLAAGYLFWLASTGRLSGNGPSDPTERAALMESGWRPNSVKIGDRWYSYQTIQPLNIPAATVANAIEAWRDQGAKPQDAPDVLAQVFARTANSVLESTFLEGTYNLIEALKDPERNVSRLVGRTATGLIPGSSALRTAARVVDPVQRQPRTIEEHVKSSLPGLSESVPPRVTRFGEPVMREGGPLQRAGDVFNSATETVDPVAQELDRLGVKLSLPSASVAAPGHATREQETEAKQRRGQAVRQALERVMADPRYTRMQDEQKAATLERLIQRVRSRESTALRRERVEASIGKAYSHPQHGAVRVVGTNPNGTVRVVKVFDDGSATSRQFIVRAGDLGPSTTPPPAPQRTPRAQRSVAAGKFSGVLTGPITRAELASLIPEMSQGGQTVTLAELEAEAKRRGLEVR